MTEHGTDKQDSQETVQKKNKKKIQILILSLSVAVPLVLIIAMEIIKRISKDESTPVAVMLETGEEPENIEQVEDEEEKEDVPEKPENEDDKARAFAKLLEQRVYVRQILVTYTDALEAGEHITLDRDRAYSVALEIQKILDREPERFEEIALEYSDDRTTALQGGLIPPFKLQDVLPSFGSAVLQLKPGEISPVFETPFGFHLIKREYIEEAILQSILIPYKGAVKAMPNILINKQRARSIAQDIREQIMNEEASFEDMAEKYSQDPWSFNRGFMSGIVTQGSIPYDEIEDVAFSLQEGEMSEVFESPLGFHILKRHRVEYRQACQIMIMYGRERSKEEAQERIEKAYKEITEGKRFVEAVYEYSDDPAEESKGFTYTIYRGTWMPELEDILFSMKVGEISNPFETKVAFVIMMRVR